MGGSSLKVYCYYIKRCLLAFVFTQEVDPEFHRFTPGLKGKVPFTPSVSVNAPMTLAILFSLKTIESLQNGVATHF